MHGWDNFFYNILFLSLSNSYKRRKPVNLKHMLLNCFRKTLPRRSFTETAECLVKPWQNGGRLETEARAAFKIVAASLEEVLDT